MRKVSLLGVPCWYLQDAFIGATAAHGAGMRLGKALTKS